jgi:hypothetical protein
LAAGLISPCFAVKFKILLASTCTVNWQKTAGCRSILNNRTVQLKFVLASDARIRTLRIASGKDWLETAGSANRV